MKMLNKATFQSGLSIPLSKAGVIFPLISSRGKPSKPPADEDNAESTARTVFFGAAGAPCNALELGTPNVSQ